MWTKRIETAGRRVRKLYLADNHRPLDYAAVIDLWRGEADAFRRFFIDILKECPYACYRFETPPASSENAGRAFEFALIDSPEIDLPPDPGDFRGHFDNSPDDVLIFDNLGGDAAMIVPRPRSGTPGYSHIAQFVRHAPVDQQLLLWKTVGEALHVRLGESPLWLNTAGGGVPWLHVRIDSRPKYYVLAEYRAVPGP